MSNKFEESSHDDEVGELSEYEPTEDNLNDDEPDEPIDQAADKDDKRYKDDQLTDYVTLAIEGSSEDLEPLCAQIIKPVLYRIMRSVPNKEDAEDIAQDVMVIVCQSIKTIKKPKFFRLWLNQVITNEINHYRANAAKGQNIEDIDSYKDLIEEDEAFMPLEMAINEESFEAVSKLVKSLAPQQQTIVTLRYYDEMTVTEIANATGLAKSTVSTQLARAHVKIKAELEEIADTLGGSAANFLSFGALMSEFMNKEVEDFATENAALLSDILAKCEPYFTEGVGTLIGAGAVGAVGVASTGGAAGSAGAGAAAGTTAVGASTAAVASSSAGVSVAATTGVAAGGATAATGFSTVVMAIAACAATVAIFGGGIFISQNIFHSEPTDYEIIMSHMTQPISVIGEIVITDGANPGETYLNVNTLSGHLALNMNAENSEWQIRNERTGEVLFSGIAGIGISAAIEQLRGSESNEAYIVSVLIRDENGQTREFYSRFN